MRILITGATGLVGRSLVTMCRQQGIAVNYLTTSKKKITKEPDYQGYYWNPATGEIDETAFLDVTTILHLAGATIAQRWTERNKQLIKDSRIKSARILYEVLERFRESGNPLPIKHVISASAIGCYPSSQTKYYDEKYPSYASSFLGEVVEGWEAAINEFQKLDIQTTLVRTGIILDKEDGALPKIMQSIKLYIGAPLGSGEQWQSWIHIKDIARLYLHILKNDLSGIYNGVAPNPVTNKKLTKMTAQVLKKPMFLPSVPKFVLKTVLGQMATIVLESQKVNVDKIVESGFKFKHSNLEGALKDLLK